MARKKSYKQVISAVNVNNAPSILPITQTQSQWLDEQLVTSSQMTVFNQDFINKIAGITSAINVPCIISMDITKINITNNVITLPVGQFRFIDTANGGVPLSTCIIGTAPAQSLNVTGTGYIVARYNIPNTSAGEYNYQFITNYIYTQAVNSNTDCLVATITNGNITGFGRFLFPIDIIDDGSGNVLIKTPNGGNGNLTVTGKVTSQGNLTTSGTFTSKSITDNGNTVTISKPFSSQVINDNGTNVNIKVPLNNTKALTISDSNNSIVISPNFNGNTSVQKNTTLYIGSSDTNLPNSAAYIGLSNQTLYFDSVGNTTGSTSNFTAPLLKSTGTITANQHYITHGSTDPHNYVFVTDFTSGNGIFAPYGYSQFNQINCNSIYMPNGVRPNFNGSQGATLNDVPGFNQSWQNLPRSIGSTYINDTGRVIMVSISVKGNNNGGNGIQIFVNELCIATASDPSANNMFGSSFLVPIDNTYRVSTYAGSCSIINWVELR